MVAYYDKLIILAFRNVIIYVNATDQKIDEEDQQTEADNVTSVEVNEANFDYLDLDLSFKIICIQEISNTICSIVLEDLETR